MCTTKPELREPPSGVHTPVYETDTISAMTDNAQEDEPEPPTKESRPRWFIPALVGAGVIVLASAGLSVAIAVSTLAPHTFTAKGAVLIMDSSCDDMSAGYDDIASGAPVAVKDASGKTVALGELGQGKDVGDAGCGFFFSVKDVPAGLGIYGIEVTHRGVIQYKEAVLKKDGAVMSLGG